MGRYATHLAALVLCTIICLGVGVAVAAFPNDLDQSFGNGGIATPSVSVNEPSRRAIGPAVTDLAPIGGRGTMAGAIGSWKEDDNFFGVARIRRNGSLDPAFGAGGIARLFADRPFQAQGVAVQTDGRILAAGYRETEPGFDRGSVLVRLRKNGDPDRSFGDSGVVTSRRRPATGGEAFFAVAAERSGRLIAVGAANQFRGRRPAGLIVAFRPNGRVDRAFGTNGRVTFSAPRAQLYTGLSAVKTLPSGKLLVSGYRGGRLFLARLLSSGSLDRSFGGGDGTVSLGVGDTEGCLARCSPRTGLAFRNGKIVTFGWQGGLSTALIRLDSTGRVDRRFGHRGRVSGREARGLVNPYDIALQGNGRIFIVGSASSTVGACDNNRAGVFAARRFLPAGRVDRAFGEEGLLTLPDSCHSIGTAALTQPNGRVVAGGGLIREVGNSSPPPGERVDSFLLLTRFLPSD